MTIKSALLCLCLLSSPALLRAELREYLIDFSDLLGVNKNGPETGDEKAELGHAHVIETGPSDVPAVALTLDDGPSIYTAPVLEILAKHDAHSTFFMIGENVAPHRDAAKRVAAAAHEIGNHSYTHPNFCSAEMSRNPNRRRVIEEEVQKATKAIQDATGLTPKLMRMPYGCNARWAEDAVQALGYDLVFWSVDCRDWSRPGSDQISRISVAQAKAGSIILLHDGGGDRSQTVRAMEAILTGLRAKGLRVLTVSQLVDANPHLKELFIQRPAEASSNLD